MPLGKNASSVRRATASLLFGSGLEPALRCIRCFHERRGAAQVDQAKLILGIGMIAFGRPFVPSSRIGETGNHPFAVRIEEANTITGLGMAASRSLLPERHRLEVSLFVVGGAAATVAIDRSQ